MPISHDAVRPGPRSFGWRPDLPATLTYVEALDGGDPKAKPVEGGHRDRLMLLPAPFTMGGAVAGESAGGEAAAGGGKEIFRTKSRFQHAQYAEDGTALVWERWYHTRRTIITRLSPDGKPSPHMEYDFSDAYNHPGSPLLAPGPHGLAPGH